MGLHTCRHNEPIGRRLSGTSHDPTEANFKKALRICPLSWFCTAIPGSGSPRQHSTTQLECSERQCPAHLALAATLRGERPRASSSSRALPRMPPLLLCIILLRLRRTRSGPFCLNTLAAFNPCETIVLSDSPRRGPHSADAWMECRAVKGFLQEIRGWVTPADAYGGGRLQFPGLGWRCAQASAAACIVPLRIPACSNHTQPHQLLH